MNKQLSIILIFLVSLVVSSQSVVTNKTKQPVAKQELDIYSAGDTTYLGHESKNSFSHPSQNMPMTKRAEFLMGDSLFHRAWVSSPSSVTASDGLGPMFSARACSSCHVKDGRGHLPMTGDTTTRSVIVKLSQRISADILTKSHKEKKLAVVAPEPTYGWQFHDRSHPGVPSEGHFEIVFDHKMISGSAKKLKRPRAVFRDLNYGPMVPDVTVSLRVAPPMIGLGLIEAISVDEIALRDDPHDLDGDGISGRMSLLSPHNYHKEIIIGRFGWKASQPSLSRQNLTAFFMDMSMTSVLHKPSAGDCTHKQTACISRAQAAVKDSVASDGHDISGTMADLILFYTQNLAPPKRLIAADHLEQQQILAGENIFYEIGCESCHRAHYKTSSNYSLKHLSSQEIFLYSDLLLHDMGPGLDDGYHEPHAYSYEWRTPPLWGLGYTKLINPKAGFLHDGRAQTIEEAILWHGGEAQAAQKSFTELSPKNRASLIHFLESL
ncbi:MAG: thiol oxidoreductase [Proteobacteria bacterium]|nr:thiol oxidoreductase [Pseudomonadota bacterium]